MHHPIDNLTCRSLRGRCREAGRRSGFSLLELMLVLAIVLVVAALAVPSVQGTISNQAISSGTDRVRVAMGQARVQSIRSGRVFAFFYQRNGQWFDVAPLAEHQKLAGQQNRSSRLTVQDRELSDNWLPREVRFVSGQTQLDSRSETTKESNNATSIDAILFYPDGTSQDAKINLRDDQGRLMAVELRGLTGLAKSIRNVGRNGQASGSR